MRLVISDTGPINYLVLIGHIDILPALFEKILLPFAVQAELTNRNAPMEVQTWMASPPAWLEVRAVPPHSFDEDEAIRALDQGEREAISLAAALQTDTLLLIDEHEGKIAARRKGLDVTGTIGVLDLAAKRGLLDLADAFDCLRKTNFYRPEKLMERMLAEWRNRDRL